MHPLALAESGWVWVGAGSRPAGLRTGRAIPGLRRDAALPVRQNTRQGREGGALPKPLSDHASRFLKAYLVATAVREPNIVPSAGNDWRFDVGYGFPI
jgi:hypothetical protein